MFHRKEKGHRSLPHLHRDFHSPKLYVPTIVAPVWAASVIAPVRPIFFCVGVWRAALGIPSKWKHNRYIGTLKLLYRTQSMGQMITRTQFKSYQRHIMQEKKVHPLASRSVIVRCWSPLFLLQSFHLFLLRRVWCHLLEVQHQTYSLHLKQLKVHYQASGVIAFSTVSCVMASTWKVQ